MTAAAEIAAARLADGPRKQAELVASDRGRKASRRPCSRACSCGSTSCACRPRARGSCPARTSTGSLPTGSTRPRRSTAPRPRSCWCAATSRASARLAPSDVARYAGWTITETKAVLARLDLCRRPRSRRHRARRPPRRAAPGRRHPGPGSLPLDVRRAAPARARQARPDRARRAPRQGVRDEDAAVDPDLPRGRARRRHLASCGRPSGAYPVRPALAGRPTGRRRRGRTPHGVSSRPLTTFHIRARGLRGRCRCARSGWWCAPCAAACRDRRGPARPATPASRVHPARPVSSPTARSSCRAQAATPPDDPTGPCARGPHSPRGLGARRHEDQPDAVARVAPGSRCTNDTAPSRSTPPRGT